MNRHAVVIVGAGPTGLMLAGELALAGVDVAIVERRANQDVSGARAGGLHSRTIEILDQRGIADRFLAEGQVSHNVGFAWFPLDMSDLPTRHNYLLALWQGHIERILAGWVEELHVPIYRSREVTGFTQYDSGVNVQISDGSMLRANFLVGCDGGRSLIRKAAGIEFPGWDPTVSHLIAEAEIEEDADWGLQRDGLGIRSLSRMEDGNGVRILVTEQQTNRTDEPTLDDLRDTLRSVYGTDFGVHSPTWVSRFTDMSRQAASYRAGRVFLAGDAAHIHYPAGGQGLNTGIQDAVNLGWKLAQVVKGESPEQLLDTYETERRPVAAAVLQNTMAQVALLRPDERTDALREIVGPMLNMDEPRKRIVGMISGLDIHYESEEGHPILGRRMPDLDLVIGDESLHLYSLLHDARPVLLNLGDPGGCDVSQWQGRIKLVEAGYDGVWELPILGEVEAPSAALIRPDGYVAWVGCDDQRGLSEAMTRWLGPPTGE